MAKTLSAAGCRQMTGVIASDPIDPPALAPVGLNFGSTRSRALKFSVSELQMFSASTRCRSWLAAGQDRAFGPRTDRFLARGNGPVAQGERIFATEAALTSTSQCRRGALEVVLVQAIFGLLLERAAGFAAGN
jgi:hypothetical protein